MAGVATLQAAFEELCKRAVGPVTQEIAVLGGATLAPPSDRRALDDIVFDVLGLTQGERDGVYEAVVRLVEKRLEKAGSLKG